jgi:hypothetical protein
MVAEQTGALIAARLTRTPNSRLDFEASSVAPPETTTDRTLTAVRHILDHVDSVYFLLFPGWEKELRGNRWHFAVRWARHKPVVLVIPALKRGPSTSGPEPRIPNCRILRIASVSRPAQLARDAQIQVGQVLADMADHGFAKPLIWCYNPNLAGLYARIPAVARVFHATEAYFDYAGLTSLFHQQFEAAVEISDLTVAVSDGVARSIRSRADRADIVTVANGCDYPLYSAGKSDAALAASGRAYRRIAIYAGNVNDRLDLALMHRLATAHPDVLFAIYGPVASMTERDASAWHELMKVSNVLAPGPVDPDRIPDLYAAADVGIIPYRQDTLIVENGLPLKALEMCASGLPVVSSLMKPLVGIASGLVVTSSAEEFIAAFAGTSRATLSPTQIAELSAVSSANDYDEKFQQVVAALDRSVREYSPATRVDRWIDCVASEWFAAEVRFSRWTNKSIPARIAGWLIIALATLVPAGLKRKFSSNQVRERLRNLREG